MTALVTIEAIVIALLILLVAGLLRSHAEILRRLHALDGGEPSRAATGGLQVTNRGVSHTPEAVTGVTPKGSSAAVALRNSRGFVLLAFLSSGCSTCRPFWEALSGDVTMPGPDVRPVIVARDASGESAGKIAEMAPKAIPTIMSSQAWDDFKISVSPYFILVEAGHGTVVGEGAAGSWDHVRDLLSSAMADAGYGGGNTEARSRRTEERLDAAGIQPGDPSLYRNPHGEGK
ncbi:MAG TPA: hypothetical protein VHL52_13490 [Acidimicrobiia bacterium]|nr:hypothetical protein [Acidimicrobiia bacterium]